MSANMLEALSKLAAIKQLDKEMIQNIILESVISTLQKRLEPESELEVYIDDLSGNIKVKFQSLVVEREEGLGQISLTEAPEEYDPEVQLGQFIEKNDVSL
jgi:N utilization substance protein A